MSKSSIFKFAPVALVTGASAGIGKASTRALLPEGHRVFGTHRRAPTRCIEGVTHRHGDVGSSVFGPSSLSLPPA